MNTVTLSDPNNSTNYFNFIFHKSVLINHCNIEVQLQVQDETFVSDKWSIHFSEIIKIANWFKNMPNNGTDVYADLIIEDLNLKLGNYFFEKGDGVYYLSYTSERGKIFKLQFWEQLGNSNTAVYKQFMDCLENCK